jgi:capsular exopolysaccharide synthesis family protein
MAESQRAIAGQSGVNEPSVSSILFGRIDALDYVRVLYRRRWLVLSVILAVVAGAGVYLYRATPLYQAQATILIDPDEPTVVEFKEVLEESGQGDYYQTQFELLQSRALAQRTVAALKLDQRPKLGWTTKTAVDVVRGGMRVAPIRGSRMANVQFRSPDPVLAAEIVNAHAREFIELNLDTRFKASKEATDWLDEQLAEERKRVEQSESALQAYREQHDAVSLAEGQDIVVQKLADLNAVVTRAKTNRIEKEAQYRELVAANQDRAALDSFPAILANGFIQQLKSELARLQREYSQLSETLGERHPTMIAKRTEIQTTENRLAAEVTRVVDSVRKAYEAARAEEASLTQALEQQKQEAMALNRRGIEYDALKREAESVRMVYQSLLQRAKETSVSRELRTTNIRIIDPAEPPRGPIWPRPVYTLFMAVITGSLLAAGLAFSLEYIQDRVRTPDDLRRDVGAPFLGLIPEVAVAEASDLYFDQHDAPASLMEAVRAVRTSVVSASLGSPSRSILVASGSQGEGKTFVATTLAVALAHAQQRVLLVDADMRRPGVHRRFGCELDPGLSNLLSGTAPLRDVLRPSAIPHLTVVAAGTPSLRAPELLGSPAFQELLRVWQEHYAWVIIDSPPLLNVTDASILARQTTGVVLVVASGSTRARNARRTIEELQRVGASLFGAVLNRTPLQDHPFYFSPYERSDYPTDPPAPSTVPPLAAARRRSA